MAYEAGTATDVVDLLNKFATFIEANGWTRDDLSNEASGRRYHAHNGSVYVNMRAYVNEDPPSTIVSHGGAGTYSWGFNVGSGYSGGSAWHQQAGAPLQSGSTYFTAGMNKMSGSISAYHFFAHNSGDNIVAVVEYESGKYQYLGFGTLSKYGTYTGGDYMFGSKNGVANTEWASSSATGVGFFQAPTPSGSFLPGSAHFSIGLITCDLDSETGWHSNGAMADFSPAKRDIFDQQYIAALVGDWLSPSSLNALHAMHPVVAAIFRDTTNSLSTSPQSMLGVLPGVHYCNIDNFVPAQQVTLGSTPYRVFPWGRKASAKSGLSSGATGVNGHTGMFGFAVEE